MSEWTHAQLNRSVESLDAGVSVNAEDRPHRAGEIGVLKTSALSGYIFHPEQNKAVVQAERRLVAEPVLANSILVSRMNTPALVGESCYVAAPHETLFLPDRIWQIKFRAEVPTSVRWLSYVLQSNKYRHFVEVNATGTSGTMKNLPKSALLSFPVSYPCEPEQTKIAEILATIDSAIKNTNAIVKKLKQVKQGLLHDLLTRGVDVNGQLRPNHIEAPELYKESPLGQIPKDWDLKEIQEIAFTFAGGTPSRDIPGFFGGSIPWVKSTEVNQDSIDSTDEKITEFGLQNSSAKWVPPGTPLIAMYGATAGVVSWLNIRATTNQAVLALLPLENIAPRWLYWALSFASKRILASVQGSGQPNLSKTTIDAILLAMPKENEQLIIAKILDQQQRRLHEEGVELNKLRATKAGLMDDLLTGRVRVTPLLAQ